MTQTELQVGVLASANSWYLRDLERSAAELCGFKIIPLIFDSLCANIASKAVTAFDPASETWVDLCALDAVVIRTMPPGSLEQVIVRMDLLAIVEQSGVFVLNPAKSIECAVDKFLTSHRLATAGIATPPTSISQTPEAAMAAFEEFGSDVVLKPLFGGEGRGITRINDADFAFRAFRWLAKQRDVIYLQPFLPHHGFDIRVLVLGGECWSMKRKNENDWRTNVSRGASTQAYEPSASEIELAFKAHHAIGTHFSGVDLLPTKSGETLVLEVNGVPGWQRLNRTLDVDMASCLLEFIREHCN